MSPHIKIDTLIISDLHMGSTVSRASDLTSLLSKHRFKRLILLGDVFDNGDFTRLNQANWELLSLLRRLSHPTSGREIIWVRGNHDKKVADIMAKLVGTKVYDQYIWEKEDKKFLAVHGDRFDSFVSEGKLTNKFNHKIFLFLQKFDREARHIVRLVEHSSSSIRGLSRKVAAGAIDYARQMRATHVFCGHTHEAMQKVHGDEKDRVHYYNVGCWTRSPSTFAVIDENGTIMMEQYA